MQLKLNKSQKKGMLGGTKFLLEANLIMDESEKALMKKLRMSDFNIYDQEEAELGGPVFVTLEDLAVMGQTFERGDPAAIVATENWVKDKLREVSARFKVAKGYDGSESVEEF